MDNNPKNGDDDDDGDDDEDDDDEDEDKDDDDGDGNDDDSSWKLMANQPRCKKMQRKLKWWQNLICIFLKDRTYYQYIEVDFYLSEANTCQMKNVG